MRRITLLLASIFLFSISGMINAQDASAPWLSGKRLAIGISLDYGKFRLEGNEGGRELIATGRDENKAESSYLGVGLLLHYRLIERLDAFYGTRYEYVTESLDDYFVLLVNDFGGHYQIADLNNFFPFVNLSYTWYTVKDLKVYDVERSGPDYSKTREYDWTGKGITLGLGAELKMGEHLYYSLDYNRLIPMGKLQKQDGFVDWENNPKVGRWSFSFRVVF
jgi:hypothetical protein